MVTSGQFKQMMHTLKKIQNTDTTYKTYDSFIFTHSRLIK